MRRLALSAWVAISASSWCGAALAQEHPRLLFGPEDVPELRERVEREPYASMRARLEAVADTDPDPGLWGTSAMAVKTAFLYVLTGDDAWAQKARAHVEDRIGDANWANKSDKGLRLYFHGKAVALAYDFCASAPSWDAPFRSEVSAKLKAQADVIFSHGGTEQNTNPASNWQANRFSSAGLCYLATDDSFTAANLTDSYDKVVRYLRENMGEEEGTRGWNSEGLGYTQYPWGHVGPFGIAMQRADATRDIRLAAPGVSRALWTTYAATLALPAGPSGNFGEVFGMHPDFGDDNNYLVGEGAYGLSFFFSDPKLQPGLRYWYDRMVGAQGDKSYDDIRAGTIYSILYYPEDVTAQNPMASQDWVDGFADPLGNGYFTYRNRYSDAQDLVAQMYLKLRGNRGHNGPDALGFRLLGLDGAWAVGGGRYGNGNVYYRSQNSLYAGDPDGALTTSGNSGSVVGEPKTKRNGGGFVVAEIGTSNVGVKNHRRRFFADYSDLSGSPGVYVVSDSSEDGRYWQINTIVLNEVETEGNTFTITAPSGASLRGHVLHPAAPSFTTGTRARGSEFGFGDQAVTENRFVHFQSDDGDHLVVLTLAEPGAEHPEVAGSGEGPLQAITVGGLEVTVLDDGFEDNAGDPAPVLPDGEPSPTDPGGSGGAGGAAAGSGGSAGGNGDGGAADAGRQAGCACRATGAPAAPHSGLLGVAGLALLAIGRRMRRQWVAG
jgi:MYXO-CTERM domain-containing protein